MSPATANVWSDDAPAIAGGRDFVIVGDHEAYELHLRDVPISFRLDHHRRHSDGLIGELTVTSTLMGARHVDNVLSSAMFNVSSASVRTSRAKLLAERSTCPHIDWERLIEEFSLKILAASRLGEPSIPIGDVPHTDTSRVLTIDGVPVPLDDPISFFGAADTGKSLAAVYLAGRLEQLGIPTLYLDFETSGAAQRERYIKLFGTIGPQPRYMRADRPLIYEADRVRDEIRRHGLQYVVIDSAGYACAGPPEQAEHCLAFWRAQRPWRVGTATIAHISKGGDDTGARRANEQQAFGSTFWHASVRASFFLKRNNADIAGPAAPLSLGLYPKKNNLGMPVAAVGWRFDFGLDRWTHARLDLGTVDELAAQLPTWQRMKAALRPGAMSVPELAVQLELPENTIRQTLRRDTENAKRKGRLCHFVRVGDDAKIGLMESES